MSMTKQEELIDRLYKLCNGDISTLNVTCNLCRDDIDDLITDSINELYILTFCTGKEVKE